MAATDKVNILLVDDQAPKLMSYHVILEELGETLLTATSAQGALQTLLKHEVAVILIDVCMPEFDGFQLAELIRGHPRFKQTAIIFVSAINLTDEDSLRGYEMGGVDYVPVPVVPGILRAKVRVFVDLYRKTRQLEQLTQELEERVASRTEELNAAIERQELLAREVDHRSKNALAVVQSIVRMTKAATTEGFAETVNGRIRAMGRAHTLLSQSRWEGADLHKLMREELAPYRDGARVRFAGPGAILAPAEAQAIALAIHEMATNAAKYGALSTPDGRLHIEWEIAADSLRLNWIEHGGPAVVAPDSFGFGTKVIESSVKSQLGGEVRFDWRAEGLCCAISFPHVERGSTSAAAPEPARLLRMAPASREDLAGKRVLLAEDEALVAVMMSDVMADMGVDVIGPFSSVAKALANGAQQLDCAVLDLNLNGESAYALADYFQTRNVPILFVTGYESDYVDGRYATVPVLQKPVELNAFADALSRQLKPLPEPAPVERP